MASEPSGPCPQLPADLLEMMARGVSGIVATRDAAHQTHLLRAVGSQIRDDGQRVTVYLSRRQSAELLADIAANGQIAVVFSEPSTHRSVQLKSTHATARTWQDSDAEVLARYLHSMEHEVAQVGFGPPFTQAMLAPQPGDVVAVSFCPEQAFDQTPGAQAGAPLGVAAA